MMAVIIGLQEVSNYLGQTFRLRLSKANNLIVTETITDSVSGATGIVKELSFDKKTAVIEPTSDEYFDIGNGITASKSTIESGTVIVMCELTAIKMFYDSYTDFVKKYTGKLYGSTVSSKEIEDTTRSGDRYYRIPDGPVTAINSLTLNGSSLTEDSDFYVNYRTGRIDFFQKLDPPVTPLNLVIDYAYGTLTIPNNVKTAAYLFVSWLWQSRNQNLTTKGAQSMSFQGRSVNFGKPVADSELNGILPEISALLKKVARIRTG
jgi:hypothetical protein